MESPECGLMKTREVVSGLPMRAVDPSGQMPPGCTKGPYASTSVPRATAESTLPQPKGVAPGQTSAIASTNCTVSSRTCAMRPRATCGTTEGGRILDFYSFHLSRFSAFHIDIFKVTDFVSVPAASAQPLYDIRLEPEKQDKDPTANTRHRH